MTHIQLASSSIENFSTNTDNYHLIKDSLDIIGTGIVLSRGKEIEAQIKIDFSNTKNCRVFIGDNIKGFFSILFKGNDSIVYIGNDCKLSNVQIRSFQNKDFIAIGNQVTTTSKNIWISGNGAGNTNPAIIIGDDCMFSYDIVIRNSDAHPIYSLSKDEQLNQPKGIVHIEPHVWIGEKVSILKSVTIGACSILSLGSIITKDVPRFSIASGVPATAKTNPDVYWSRGETWRQKKRAIAFTNKYKAL